MKARRGVALSFTLFWVSASGQAQDLCVDLAKSIVYNKSREFSYDEQRDIKRSELCLEEYKKEGGSRSASVEAAYKFFSFGAGGSESQIREEQKKQCDNRFGDYWALSIKSSQARTASNDSLRVVEECLRLNSKGMRPRLSMSHDGREFTLSLEWNPSTPNPLQISHAGPLKLEAYTCRAQSGPGSSFRQARTSEDTRATVAAGSSYALSCERPPVKRVVDGEDLTCFDDLLLSIVTNGPTAAIPIPAICTPSMPGERARAIEDRLGALETQLGSVAQHVGQMGTVLATSLRECRVCFRETEGSDQCQGERSSCSGWSTGSSWSAPFRDDTDGRSGGCKYSWLLECRPVSPIGE